MDGEGANIEETSLIYSKCAALLSSYCVCSACHSIFCSRSRSFSLTLAVIHQPFPCWLSPLCQSSLAFFCASYPAVADCFRLAILDGPPGSPLCVPESHSCSPFSRPEDPGTFKTWAKECCLSLWAESCCLPLWRVSVLYIAGLGDVVTVPSLCLA